ncbi:MAG: hypothetical protein AAF266_07230 [Planctomycetota bacterium]
MKIVQVIPDFGLGGIQKAGCVLAEGLGRQGHEAVVIGQASGDRFQAAPPDGVVHHVSTASTPTDYAEEILRLEPDVVHIHAAAYEEELVDALTASGSSGSKQPLLVSTPVFGRPPKKRSLLTKTRTAVVGTYILYRLRHWLSLTLNEALEAGIAFTPVVSFQATDPPCSTLDSADVLAARRAEFGIPKDAEVVGRIGRDSPEKWSPANRELIDRFLSKRPRGVWLSVGFPEEIGRSELEERWGDRFIALPQSSDYPLLSKAFAAMDVQAFFSCAGECFAATICEPAGVGLPTIAGTNPLKDNGQSEQVVDGQTGYLVASIDEALDRIDALLDTPTDLIALKQATSDYAHARWTPDQIVQDLLALYEAWMSEEPLKHSRMQQIREEAEAFDKGYVPRMLRLHGGSAAATAWWSFKLAATRSWPLFRVGARLKRFLA